MADSSERPPKIHTSCDGCLRSKVRCGQGKPQCARCQQHGLTCTYSQYRPMGRPSHKSQKRSLDQQGPSAPASTARASASPPEQARPYATSGHSSKTPASMHDRALAPAQQLDPFALGRAMGGTLTDFTLDNFHAAPHLAQNGNVETFGLLQGCDLDRDTLMNLDASNMSLSSLFNDPLSHPNGAQVPIHTPPHRASSAPSNSAPQSEIASHTMSLAGRDDYFAQHAYRSMPLTPNAPEFTPDYTRCSCHDCLSDRMTWLSASSFDTDLDALLDLDDEVSEERERVLRCMTCSTERRQGQTLLLIIITMAKLLTAIEIAWAERPKLRSGQQHASAAGAGPSAIAASGADSKTVRRHDGDREGLVRKKLHSYANRQLRLTGRLEEVLGRADERDMSRRLARELLSDVYQRVDHLSISMARILSSHK